MKCGLNTQAKDKKRTSASENYLVNCKLSYLYIIDV